MQKLLTHPIHLLFVVLVLLSACEKEKTTPTPTPTNGPWKTDFIFGNFSLNGYAVTTNQDGTSLAYQADYVTSSSLLNTFSTINFTNTSVRIYVPTEDNYVTVVSNQSIQFQTEGGYETANVYNSGSFVNQQTIGGQLYSVYQLQGVYGGSPTINATNFANVVFTCNVSYKENDVVVGTRTIGVEVYKR